MLSKMNGDRIDSGMNTSGYTLRRKPICRVQCCRQFTRTAKSHGLVFADLTCCCAQFRTDAPLQLDGLALEQQKSGSKSSFSRMHRKESARQLLNNASPGVHQIDPGHVETYHMHAVQLHGAGPDARRTKSVSSRASQPCESGLSSSFTARLSTLTGCPCGSARVTSWLVTASRE